MLLCTVLAVVWATGFRVTSAEETDRAERRPLVLDRPPVRAIQDPYSVFNGIALDVERGEIIVADDNLYSLSVYRSQFIPSDKVREPLRRLRGSETELGRVCGVSISPEFQEIYAVSGEGGGEVRVFPMEANGNVAPIRVMDGLDHGSSDVFLDRKNDEIFILVEHINKIYVHRRTAKSGDKPLRFIQGPNTELADPHGVFVDSENNEIFVTNHGHWQKFEAGDRYMDEADGEGPKPLGPSTGKFVPPSITVYSRTAQGDVAPLRTIQGSRTQLNLPLGMYLDSVSGQIVVASAGDDSILFFDREAHGNVAPVREIRGPATGLAGPSGVFLDTQRNELWVGNWDNHTATAYPRTAQGNVAPLRTIRSAPKGAPTTGFGNIGDVAFDPKRKEILVPN